jgi:hypothetical protein
MITLFWAPICETSTFLYDTVVSSEYLRDNVRLFRVDEDCEEDQLPNYLRGCPTLVIETVIDGENVIECKEGPYAMGYIKELTKRRNRSSSVPLNPYGAPSRDCAPGEGIVPFDYRKATKDQQDDLSKKIAEYSSYYDTPKEKKDDNRGDSRRKDSTSVSATLKPMGGDNMSNPPRMAEPVSMPRHSGKPKPLPTKVGSSKLGGKMIR